MKHTNIKANKTARVFQSGEIDKETRTIWFLLHGYGQSGHEMIKAFEHDINETTVLIAPDALNKFYLRGHYGKVGSSWMTKENREAEIHDYINYLNSVYELFTKKKDINNIEINALGFSQGCETLSRWGVSSEINFNKLILHSGGIPKDVFHSHNNKTLLDKNLFLIRGDNDKLINKEKWDLLLQNLDKRGIQYHTLTFNGGHEINRNLVKQVMEGKFDDK
jgi:predicted esterase